MNEILVAQTFCTYAVYFLAVVVVVGITVQLINE